MDLNVIGFAAARTEAINRSLPEADANQIGVIGSLAGSTLIGWVVGRSLAERKAAELAAAQPRPDVAGGTPGQPPASGPAPGPAPGYEPSSPATTRKGRRAGG